jgi:hypothetical protein
MIFDQLSWPRRVELNEAIDELVGAVENFPAYLVGIPGLRSAVWAVGFASHCAMTVPLFTERTIVREAVTDGTSPD